MSTYTVSAVPTDVLARIRARGVDDFGNPMVVRTNHDPSGPPLRCCLQDAAVGDRYVLVAFQPAAAGGPYAEVGPVFVHADACEGWSGSGLPQYRPRLQLLRAYDADGLQVDNVIVGPDGVTSGIQALFERPEIAFVHSRNPLPGCWMFTAERAAG